ncbi:MarR family transcriptional regulator [soil metagenome]
MKVDLTSPNPSSGVFYTGEGYSVAGSIGYSLRNLTYAIKSEIEARMSRHGVTAAQWHPLFLLKLDHVGTALELARELGIDAGATTRMVDRLVAKGLVERVRSDSDRRVVHLGLTATGREVADLIPHVLASVQNDFLGGFTGDELVELKRLVKKMLDNGAVLRAARPQGEAAAVSEPYPCADVDSSIEGDLDCARKLDGEADLDSIGKPES